MVSCLHCPHPSWTTKWRSSYYQDKEIKAAPYLPSSCSELHKNKRTHTNTRKKKNSSQVTQKTQTQCYQALHFYQLFLPPSPQYSYLSLKSQKEIGCAKPQTTSSPSPGKYITTLDNLELFSISSLCTAPYISNSSTTFCQEICSAAACVHVCLSFKAWLWLCSQQRRKKSMEPT